jgi:hypothetical protein
MKNMYKDVKYAIKFADGETCMFSSKVGVKQGCILSPTHFSIYLNDMVKIYKCRIKLLFAFLHKSSVALVKLPEDLNNIPKYLYSLVISST